MAVASHRTRGALLIILSSKEFSGTVTTRRRVARRTVLSVARFVVFGGGLRDINAAVCETIAYELPEHT